MVKKFGNLILILLVMCLGSAHASETLDDIDHAIHSAYDKYKNLKEGQNANYIPILAKMPSDLFGIAVVTVDGRVYTVGDSTAPFSIQSISKVFTLAQVLDEKGEKAIEDAVGVAATGDSFDSITAVEKRKGLEINPFVNAGAIATTALISAKSYDEAWNKILKVHSDFAGRPLKIDETVYKSEAATNEKNRATSVLMHNYGRIQSDPLIATDLYTRQCAISVNTKDLAVMAATLANGGINPITKKGTMRREHVKGLLAVMATAGLYTNSGKWLFETGLPAKSGVGGGFIAVSPGRFGIAAFSPRLDSAGNSIRAQKAIADISAALAANPYEFSAKAPLCHGDIQQAKASHH